MAASAFTPILLYASGTTGNTPSATNLTSSSLGAELALNYTDGKLFYKDNAGTVQVLASKASASTTFSGGTTGLTPSTATTGAITLAGTLVVSNGGTGATTLTGLIKGNGTSAFTAAVSGTDYAPATSGTSILYGNGSGGFSNVTVGSGLTFTGGTLTATSSGGSVTSVSVVTANGFAGTVATATSTPAITLTTSITGVLKGNGTAISAATAGTDYTTPTGLELLSNKRINPRVSATTTASSLTPDVSVSTGYDEYAYTALASALTINAPTGTPVDGNKLIFRLLDNGTAQTLSWNSTYTIIGVTLPTTTVANKTTYVGCIYNANNTRWDVVAVTTQA